MKFWVFIENKKRRRNFTKNQIIEIKLIKTDNGEEFKNNILLDIVKNII